MILLSVHPLAEPNESERQRQECEREQDVNEVHFEILTVVKDDSETT